MQAFVSCNRNVMGVTIAQGEGLHDLQVIFDPLTSK